MRVLTNYQLSSYRNMNYSYPVKNNVQNSNTSKSVSFGGNYLDVYERLSNGNPSFTKIVPKELYERLDEIPELGLPRTGVSFDDWKREDSPDGSGTMKAFIDGKLRAFMTYEPNGYAQKPYDFMPEHITVYNTETNKKETEYAMRQRMYMHHPVPCVDTQIDYYEDGKTPKYKIKNGDYIKAPWHDCEVTHYNEKGKVDAKYKLQTGYNGYPSHIEIKQFNDNQKVTASYRFG